MLRACFLLLPGVHLGALLSYGRRNFYKLRSCLGNIDEERKILRAMNLFINILKEIKISKEHS